MGACVDLSVTDLEGLFGCYVCFYFAAFKLMAKRGMVGTSAQPKIQTGWIF